VQIEECLLLLLRRKVELKKCRQESRLR